MGEMIYPKRLSGTVKKTFSVVAMTVLSGLLLTSCSGVPMAAPADAPVSSPTATSSSAPALKIDETQRDSLMAELQKIDPALGTQRSVATARQGCRMILNNEPEEMQLAFAEKMLRIANIQPDATSAEKAKKIIAVIKNSGFCKADS